MYFIFSFSICFDSLSNLSFSFELKAAYLITGLLYLFSEFSVIKSFLIKFNFSMYSSPSVLRLLSNFFKKTYSVLKNVLPNNKKVVIKNLFFLYFDILYIYLEKVK